MLVRFESEISWPLFISGILRWCGIAHRCSHCSVASCYLFLRAKQKVGSRARAMRVIQRYVIVWCSQKYFFLQFFSSDACSGFERQGRRTRWLASHSRWNTGMLINCYRNRVFFFLIWQRISDNFCLASVELFSRFKRRHQRALANRNKAVIFSTNQGMLVTHFSRAYHL